MKKRGIVEDDFNLGKRFLRNKNLEVAQCFLRERERERREKFCFKKYWASRK